MSSFAAYGRLEKAIAAADTGSIRQRWEYGRRLLVDRTKSGPGGSLQHGVLDGLVAAGKRHGATGLNRREIQHRLQAARLYPSEAHIAHICAQFDSWGALRTAGFPPVQLALDEVDEPFDPRTVEERARDAGITPGRLEEAGAGQLALFSYFPEELFDELSTLGELEKHAGEMADWTARRVRKDQERTQYVRRLLAAVNGDRSKTWREAQDAMESAA